MSHRCPGRGCTVDVDDTKLACLAHWRTVPKPLQIDLVVAYKYRNDSAEAGKRYEDLRARAVKFLIGR